MKKDMTEKTNVETLFRLLKWLYEQCRATNIVTGDNFWEDSVEGPEKQEIENLMKEENKK